MKGDLVNGLTFLVVLPGYFYLAWYHVDDNNNDSNNNDNLLIQTATTSYFHDCTQIGDNRSVDDASCCFIDSTVLTLLATKNDYLDMCLWDQASTAPSLSPLFSSTAGNIAITNATATSTATSTATAAAAAAKNNMLMSGPWQVCLFFTWTVLFSLLSWQYKNNAYSAIAFIFSWIATMCMSLYNWPHTGETILLPQHIWHIVILTANGLPLRYQIFLCLFGLICSIIVVFYSPLMYNADELCPIFFGVTALHILVQIFVAADQKKFFSLKNDAFRSIFASCVLTATFAYHVCNEMITIYTQPGYAITGGFSILRAGFFASFGLFAAGAFKTEYDAKELLEKLVQERTKQIMQQARRLRMVEMALEASETAIAITDNDLKIVWFNPAMKELSRKKDTDLLDEYLTASLDVSDSDCAKIRKCFDERMSLEDEIVVSGNTCIRIQVGPFPDDEISLFPSTDSTSVSKKNSNHGTNTSFGNRFVVVLKDFTERRRRELAEKQAEKEAMLKQAMSESCQILSHELRTPLQGIMGVTSMLLSGNELTTDASDSLSLVMVSSRLLLTLINNMLDVRKMDANMMQEFALVPTELFHPVLDAVNFCRPLGAMSNIKIEMLLSERSNIIVLSDALRLQQVFINLISNSIKHCSSGCKISVIVRFSTLDKAEKEIDNALQCGTYQDAWDVEYANKKDQMKVIVASVSDTGNGLDVGQAQKLFHKFSQLNDQGSTNTIGGNKVGQPTGTGLGLNLCLKFINRMKGNIWATNNPTGGACFSFYLPLISGEEVQVLTDQENLPTVLEQVPSFVLSQASKCRLLIVDDTVINLKVLQRMVKRIGIDFVTCVDSGPKALIELEKDYYNLVITDIQMPEMTGTELCREIFSRTCLRRKPIVVGLTAEVSRSLNEQCEAIGMLTLLTKPMTMQQLVDFFEYIVPRLDGKT